MKYVLNLSLALLVGLGFATATVANAQTITQLFSFPCPNTLSGSCADGYSPNVLIQASDGNFYGAAQLTTLGTSNPQGGTLFKLTPSGQFTRLFTFTANSSGNYVNGDQPATSLVEGNDGLLYGTTFTGGAHNSGVLFRIGKTGQGFKVVHDFCSATNCADGNLPLSLILGHDGNLYGVTLFGGSNDQSCQTFGGCGTIFRFTLGGTFTTLHQSTGGAGTVVAPTGLVQGSDGNFYGTAGGTVFRFTSGGQITILHTFSPVGFDPTSPSSPLLQASNGNLYGGVTHYQINDLQFYEISPSGNSFETFPSFGHNSDPDGVVPRLIQASDGNLWDVSDVNDGSVIMMSPTNGVVLQQFSFSGTNGANPQASVVQGADGKIYGTATQGGMVANGKAGMGTVWSLDAGLPAPEATIAALTPSSGIGGSKVTIRGDHFIGTTAVTFNGVKAAFKVLNVNFITAVVPADATTGPIAVTNAGGTTDSSTHFTMK